jgi:rhamnogalacturonan endolyase
MNTSNEYTYSVGDGSMGDVDGDGEYEFIIKWDPSNAHDNSHFGYTGNVLLDCYKLDGTRLWRIDLGRNIRAGAHYTQFMVYDLDGDGRAEVVMKTADGTVDGTGRVLGDSTMDYRNSGGYILDGPEYLTVFDGRTGRALATTDYLPARGEIEGWGDNYGNRCDRFLAAVAYLDGRHPSVVMCRGYYTRTVLVAWDWNGRKLRHRWTFDTNDSQYADYKGQGNHNLRVGDVDGDGCDEIIYGAMAVDHDGKGLYTTGLGHGDALHMAGFIPGEAGLQVWDCHENHRDGSSFRDARTGRILFQIPSTDDVGRCMAADIDPTNPGLEMWSLDSKGIRNYRGEVVTEIPRGLSYNMAVWWDGDLLRELLDGNRVSKYDWRTHTVQPIATFEGCRSINGSKSTPVLQGDILGDWREEVLMRTEDNRALRLYVTPIATDYRFHSFLQDPVYRISIATENVSYNQPTQPGFYFGPDLKAGEMFRGTQIK